MAAKGLAAAHQSGRQDIGKQGFLGWRPRPYGKRSSGGDARPWHRFDRPLPMCGEQTMFHPLGQARRAWEIAGIVGQRVQPKPDRVVAEAMAGKAYPVERILSFLDVPLRRAPAVVELGQRLRRTGQAGRAKTDPRAAFAGMH